MVVAAKYTSVRFGCLRQANRLRFVLQEVARKCIQKSGSYAARRHPGQCVCQCRDIYHDCNCGANLHTSCFLFITTSSTQLVSLAPVFILMLIPLVVKPRSLLSKFVTRHNSRTFGSWLHSFRLPFHVLFCEINHPNARASMYAVNLECPSRLLCSKVMRSFNVAYLPCVCYT